MSHSQSPLSLFNKRACAIAQGRAAHVRLSWRICKYLGAWVHTLVQACSRCTIDTFVWHRLDWDTLWLLVARPLCLGPIRQWDCQNVWRRTMRIVDSLHYLRRVVVLPTRFYASHPAYPSSQAAFIETYLAHARSHNSPCGHRPRPTHRLRRGTRLKASPRHIPYAARTNVFTASAILA
ncbi:hypothetical protein NUW54_g13342 [Trametes sanguinea]|uniref:Uncharacterized protein n=1 Tax=Trametes sanguinea TaxID=158606 RepID=A0ACC1MN99_9APHY|nr:hypothetical protein NUW54_g13342 [Trametes sanguinea]